MTFVYNSPITDINGKIPFTGGVRYTKAATKPDSFNYGRIYDSFADKETIMSLVKSNPVITDTLRKNKIPLNVNMTVLNELKNGHLKNTRIIAAKIYSALPPEIKKEVNSADLQEAALLHDYGKVLIPDKILNKNGKLTDEERRIVDLHSELGYELLKQQGVKEDVLNLVKYHHKTPSGYSASEEGFTSDWSAQILVAADKYSALREKRSYKDALSHDAAMNILRSDVDTGTMPEEIFEVLEKFQA